MTRISSLAARVSAPLLATLLLASAAQAQEPQPSEQEHEEGEAHEEHEEEAEEIIVQGTRTRRRIQDEPIRVEVIVREEIEEKLLMRPGNIAMLVNETPPALLYEPNEPRVPRPYNQHPG